MIGGLWKSTSRLALAASAAMFVGGMAMPSAQAADLGGDCCADLEERVAELEATTARKGNRKLSLTISGQVNKMIMFWDDGKSSKTLYGVENRNSSTRLDFMGEAKVTPQTKLGFEIMLDNSAGASSGLSQFDSNGKVNAGIQNFDAPSFTGNNADNYFGAARRMVFFADNDKLGRITVGHYEMAGAITTIDLGGISAGASSSMSLVNGGFLLRGGAGQYYGISWKNITDAAVAQSRQNELRYDSPAFMGFILSGSIADEGSNYGGMLRYANEFSGFRIAGGIGIEHYGQVTADPGCNVISTTALGTAPVAGGCGTALAGPANLTNFAPDVTIWGAGLSAMHVPSGLFVQGHYYVQDFGTSPNNTNLIQNSSYLWGDNNKNGELNTAQWLIQAGIAKNWTGFGNTAIFGEYGHNQGQGACNSVFVANNPNPTTGAQGCDYSNATIPGATTIRGVTGTEVTMYGFGITQTVDAAATEIYLNARHFDADVTCSSTAANCGGAAANIGSVASQKLDTEGFWAVIGGARLKF